MKRLYIETKRLRLIMLKSSDLAAWLKSKNEIEEILNCKFVEEISSLNLRNIFNIKIHNIENDPDNVFWYTYFAITLKSQNTVIGMIGYKDIPDNENRSEVGYGINNQFSGKGFATEALFGLAYYTLENTKLTAITAETYIENTASQKVLDKNNFKFINEENNLRNYELNLKDIKNSALIKNFLI